MNAPSELRDEADEGPPSLLAIEEGIDELLRPRVRSVTRILGEHHFFLKMMLSARVSNIATLAAPILFPDSKCEETRKPTCSYTSLTLISHADLKER